MWLQKGLKHRCSKLHLHISLKCCSIYFWNFSIELNCTSGKSAFNHEIFKGLKFGSNIIFKSVQIACFQVFCIYKKSGVTESAL